MLICKHPGTSQRAAECRGTWLNMVGHIRFGIGGER